MEFNTTESMTHIEEKPISDVQFLYNIIEERNSQIAKLKQEIEEDRTKLEKEIEYSKAITDICGMMKIHFEYERKAKTRKEQQEINRECEELFKRKMDGYWAKFEIMVDKAYKERKQC